MEEGKQPSEGPAGPMAAPLLVLPSQVLAVGGSAFLGGGGSWTLCQSSMPALLQYQAWKFSLIG